MAKNDMRWRRTERNIMEAMGTALAEKPLDKISVTAIARAADINKATFYLHYHDIYDAAVAYTHQRAENAVHQMEYLAEFFDSPDVFAKKFVDDLEAHRPEFDPILRNDLMPALMDRFTQTMKERLFELRGAGPGDRREDIMLTFIVSGFLSAAARFAETDKNELVEIGGHLLAGIQEYGERHFGPIKAAPRIRQ